MKQKMSLLCWNNALLNRKYLFRVWLPVFMFLLVGIVYRPIMAQGYVDGQMTEVMGSDGAFPNDPTYQNAGQYSLDMINVQEAWRYTHGDPKVTVALIDTGIDFTHPELADHIHPDAHDILGQGTAQDEHGHGTLAAGIIGAAINNKLGSAGIASNVQILPIKVSPGSTRQGSAMDEQLAPAYGFQDAISYAASPDRNGTRVVNINFATSIDDAAERVAIAQATQSGVLIVAATGNTSQNRTLFPAAYDCVLGVGAVDRNAQRASFSTYGLGVDVVAPGVAIYGPDLMGEKGYNQGDYTTASGTSFASPHASGVAALLFSARPDLSAWDVREIMMRSAQDLGPIGFDLEYGYGLLDAGAAMELAKVWRANTSKALDHCTGERYRVYGSLYLDQNQNGTRDASDLAFSEPYTGTTTYVELYGRNGTRLLGVASPNAEGIFTFDVIYDTYDALYTMKLQNSTMHHKLFFSAGMAGPYNIDMGTLPAQALTIKGTLFVDSNSDGNPSENEPSYMPDSQTPATVALYERNGQAPIATATSDSQGSFVFYLAPLTTTVTYELRANIGASALAATRVHTITLAPTMEPVITYAMGVASNTIPTSPPVGTSNPTPTNLQVITHTGSIVLSWTTPQPLLRDSAFEIAYARQPGGPYQALGTTALAQTTNYTIFDLPGVASNGDYYFIVRARSSINQPIFWSGYSNEVVLRTALPDQLLPTQPVTTQLFLPLVNR